MNINREELEELLLRDDVISYFSNLSQDDLLNLFGPLIARMKGYDQKNSHHCFDLLDHILHALVAAPTDGLSNQDIIYLKVATFFHDVAKPDVAVINPKTNEQAFYGHSTKSAELAIPTLKELGYSNHEIDRISFFIAHHDDLINYKNGNAPIGHIYMKNTTPESFAEKILENKYDFSRMGYTPEQIRLICHMLTHSEPANFKSPKPAVIKLEKAEKEHPINIADILEKMYSGKYLRPYVPTLDDYRVLTSLCVGDSFAQSDKVVQNGKIITNKDKVKNVEVVRNVLSDAFRIAENITKPKSINKALLEAAITENDLSGKISDAKKLLHKYQANLPHQKSSDIKEEK